MEMLQHDFMLRALAAGLIVATLAPLVGVFLVLRRFSLMADTLSHVSLVGVAVGGALGLHPGLTALLAAVLGALGIELLKLRARLYSETTLAIFLTGGLATALVVLRWTGGLGVDLLSYLFGSILTVQPTDLWLAAGAGLAGGLLLLGLGKEFFFLTFDEEGASLSGLPVGWLTGLFSLVTAVTVAVAMRLVGVLLVGALAVLPAVTAFQWARSFRHSLGLAVLFAQAAVLAGLTAAYYLDMPAGAAVVLAALLLFGLSSAVKRLLPRPLRRPAAA